MSWTQQDELESKQRQLAEALDNTCHCGRDSKYKDRNGKAVCELHFKPFRAPIKYTRRPPGRNEPCPCGSGKKFKVCCQKGVIMPNPAAVAYEAYRKYLHEQGKTEMYLLPWKDLSQETQSAWWAAVRALTEMKYEIPD